jgi:elongation factor P
MASTSDFKTGFILLLEGELYLLVDFQHVKMGRGGAFVRTKLKNLKTGRVIERTFRSGEKVDEAQIDRRTMQYLYREGDQLVFMDVESFEQIPVAESLLQSGSDFLKESENVTVFLYNEMPIGAELPNFVNLTIASTEPGIRGDTVSGATKRAVLESGGSVQVPLFVEEGQMIRVDTRTGQYMERVK